MRLRPAPGGWRPQQAGSASADACAPALSRLLPPHPHPHPPPPLPTGAGNKIIRCEVSLDDGKSWRLAEVTHRTPPNEYGKHWAWVWWSLDVSIGEPAAARPC